MEVFRQAAETYTRELLQRIALDYSLPLDDLLKYADLTPTVQTVTPTPPKTPNPFDKPLCQATTSSGTRCRFYARQDGLCGKHALPVEGDPGTPRTCQPVGTGTCSGTTAKGAPCKFAAKTAVGLCGTHLRTSRPPTPPTSVRPTSPSPRALSPVRSRSPTPPPLPRPKTTVVRKAPSPAPPVKPKATTQPSVLEEDPEDDDEVSDSPGLQERLRAILKEASESDDDPDDDLNLDSLRAALDTVAVSELLSDDEDASTDGEDDD